MACVTHAIEAYIRRHRTETNPRIAQVLTANGGPEGHWYYASDQVVSTSDFFLLDNCEIFPPYEGPLEGLPAQARPYFSEERSKMDDIATSYAAHISELGFRTFEEYLMAALVAYNI